MERAIGETNRRRAIQTEYNEKHGLKPETIIKDIRDVIEITRIAETVEEYKSLDDAVKYDVRTLEKSVKKLEADMRKASKELQFEQAAYFRDELFKMKKELTRLRSGN